MSFRSKFLDQSTASSASPARYQIQEDIEETWQVVDTMSGLAAATNGRDLVQLGRKDAIDLAKDLNECEKGG